MNKELLNQMSEIIQGSKDFVVEQAPQAVQQYLQMQAIDSLGWLALSIIAMTVSVFIVCLFEDETKWIPASILFIFATCGIISNPINYYKITHYPKGYILQHVLRSNGK